ncbi:MAG: Uncharacterised protein [Prochlorococcus marinus str. MIT 9215]|jgi:hypothetical protein|nr:MAG: Uncharacterised protein [Prochlorococcus marinus str. MIT 9215]
MDTEAGYVLGIAGLVVPVILTLVIIYILQKRMGKT